MIIKAIKDWFTLRDDRSKEKLLKRAQHDAKHRIYIADSKGKLYVTFDDFPAIALDDTITVSEALLQLEKLRDQYVASHV